MRVLLLTTLLACDGKGSPTDSGRAEADTDTDADADADTDTDTDTDTEAPALVDGSVGGVVMALVGDDRIRLRGASVYLTDGLEGTVSVETDEWGQFRIARGTAEQQELCVAVEGASSDTCVSLSGADDYAGEVEVSLSAPAAWGRVSLSDGRACVHRLPDFGVRVDTVVSTDDGREVLANMSGEYVIPGYSGALTVACEEAAAGAAASGEQRADIVLGGDPPEVGPVVLAGRGSSTMRPQPGTALTATIEVSEGATVRWRADGLDAEGTKVAWSVPSDPGEARLWALVSDGKGHHRLTSARIMVGEPMVWLGALTDADGAPIAGATITVNGVVAETDAEGLYDLEVAEDAERYLTTIRHPDYTPCHLLQHDAWRGSVLDELGGSGERCLRPLDTQTFEASRGATLKVGDAEITIAGGVLVDAAGAGVSGSVEAAWYAAAPGEPLAAEPILLQKDDTPVYAETLGGLHLVFRDPSDPTSAYTAVKPVQVSQPVPDDTKDDDTLIIASIDDETGRLTHEEVAVEHTGDSWAYSLVLPPGGTFIPVVPIWETGCIRVNVPEARFPGTLAVTASIPGTQASLPQLVSRPVNSNLVVFGGLPLQETVDLFLFHHSPTQGLLVEDTASVLVSAKVSALSTIDAYPFDPVCADVTLPTQAPRGDFLTRHLLNDVTHYKSLLMTAEQAGNLYYAAIDPLGEKTTLSDWLDSLGWSKTDPRDQTGDEAFAIYGNAGDLGFGREMHLQIQDNPDGDNSTADDPVVAMYTTNYANVHHAAVASGVVATVAMEYAPHPTAGGSYYTKFFVFDAAGDRISTIALDDNGPKAVPDLCVNCHGGQPAQETDFFTVDQGTNTVSLMHPYPNDGRLGDAARFIPFAVETFDYSPLYPQVSQEEAFRVLNEALLETNVTDDARALLHGWYDDEADYALDTLGATGDTQDTLWHPTGAVSGGTGGDWTGQEALYEDVYQPYCRSCHVSFDHVDFADASQFLAYAGLIQAYVCSQPTTMPQAQVTQRNLFHDGDALQTLVDEMGAGSPQWTAKHCPQ